MKDGRFPAEPIEPGTDNLPLGYRNLKIKPGFRKKVLDILADGRWHTTAEVFASLRDTFPAATHEVAQNSMHRLLRDPPPGRELESEKVGNRCRYRLRKSAASSRHVPASKLTDFMNEFPELLRQLEEWSNKGQYEIVPSSLQGIVLKMKRLIAALKHSISS